MSKKRKLHWGATLDNLLGDEGIHGSAKAEAPIRVVAWQLGQEMARKGMSKAKLAELMHASRTQVDRVPNATGNVTIESLQRAAVMVGRELRLELI